MKRYIKQNPEKLAFADGAMLYQFYAFGVQQGQPELLPYLKYCAKNVSPGNQVLRDKIGIAISTLAEDGRLQDLIEQYDLSVF